jgi:hypothetical protein
VEEKMSIAVMKQALEALEMLARYENPETKIQVRKPKDGGPIVTMYPHKVATDAADVLRAAIEQTEKQEAWKTSDTAYRPDGLPQDFIVHEVENEGDWSEWVCPDPEQYFMKCCDCGLVHEMQFKVVKYSVGDECDGVDDPDVRGIFRARRRSNA